MPAESALKRSVVATRSAESAAALGTPSWRKALLPQQYASPLDVNPQACESPTARLTRTTFIGTGIFGPALNASRLLQKTRSSLRMAQYLCSKNAKSRVEVTCTRASPRRAPLTATIVARPSVSAVTTPESETLAMAGAELLQRIGAPVTTVSRVSYTVASNETRRPSENVDSAGVIVRRVAGLPDG